MLLELRSIVEATVSGSHHPLTVGRNRWHRLENLLVCQCKRFFAEAMILPKRRRLEVDQVLRWRVISCLAEGADRIVAQQAGKHLRAKLEAALPYAPGEYRKDFKSSASVAEFDDLIAHADRVARADLQVEDGPEQTPPPDRVAGYRRAGELLVNSCEILIAIWDGNPARGEGGTAEVVRYALSLDRLVIWINALEPDKPASLLAEVNDQGWPQRTRPLPALAVEWSANLVQLVEYNRDPAFDRDEFERPWRHN